MPFDKDRPTVSIVASLVGIMLAIASIFMGIENFEEFILLTALPLILCILLYIRSSWLCALLYVVVYVIARGAMLVSGKATALTWLIVLFVIGLFVASAIACFRRESDR